MGYNWGQRAASIRGGLKPRKTGVFRYCLEAVQRPVQPSDRTNEPEPVRPEKRPVLFQLKPCTDPPLLVAPFGLTDPELKSPEILPPEMTNLSVALPQGVPTATEPMSHRNCHRRRLHHRFFATRGAARRIRVWRDAPAWKIRPRVASRVNRTAIFRRCRCCRRRCRIALAPRLIWRPRSRAKGGQFRSNVEPSIP